MPAPVNFDSSVRDRLVGEIANFDESNPTLIPKLMKMTGDASTPVGELAHLLSHDPALTATVMRLANSAFFGRCRAVATVEEAVMVLGFTLLRSVIIAANMASVFAPGDEVSPRQKLWDHSLAVALGSRMVAACVGRVPPEEAFLAGLMHDVGLLVFFHRCPDECQALLSNTESDCEGQLALEQELLGTTHADLGASLLEKWSFPKRIVDSVRYHHNPEAQLTVSSQSSDQRIGQALAHIVCFANLMASALGYNYRNAKGNDWASCPSIAYLHLTAESSAWIAHNLQERFAEERLLLIS